MATTRIVILDQTGRVATTIEVPDDVIMSQLIPELVTSLNLPVQQGGNLISYRLDRLLTAERLAEDQTLQDAEIENGEKFSLSPEVTAGCFPAGTQISLVNGTRVLIENLKIGDFVLSYSRKSSSISKSQVTGIYHGFESLFLLINEFFQITPSHLIQIDGNWRRADSLRIGDHLHNEKGEQVEVYSIEIKESETEVYNIDLDTKNIYYAEGVRVSDFDERFTKKETNFFANGYLVNTFAAKLAVVNPLPINSKRGDVKLFAVGNANSLPEDVKGKSDLESNTSLRDWWHTILRGYGHYSCYGIFLLLPSDKEAIRYFVDFGDELDLITASDCLIIAFSKNEFHTPINLYDDQIWQSVIGQQISEGHSVKVADFFGIDYQNFPCIVLFKDIRNPKHIVISLKNSSADEIATKLRKTFSIIHKAAKSKSDPLEAIRLENNKQIFMSQGQSVVSDIRNIVGKTFETGIEAWIKTSLSPK